MLIIRRIVGSGDGLCGTIDPTTNEKRGINMTTSVLSSNKRALMISIIVVTLLNAVMLSACGISSAANAPSGTASSTLTAVASSATQSAGVVLTKEELAKYNGQGGQPAYIAVDSVIYDVTNVPQWNGGQHKGFEAGQDLTAAIKTKAPHGISVLAGVPVAGSLK
jgi:predicted heme/steroid binding protein